MIPIPLVLRPSPGAYLRTRVGAATTCWPTAAACSCPPPCAGVLCLCCAVVERALGLAGELLAAFAVRGGVHSSGGVVLVWWSCVCWFSYIF